MSSTPTATTAQNEALFSYLLRLADASLILGHRLSELCGHGISLEDDIATTNTALDLIGQARYFYQYSCEIEGKGRTEDDLAYLRLSNAFYNPLLVELPNGHFGETIVRQFFFDAFNHLLLKELAYSKDEQIAAIAKKAFVEVQYHLQRSSRWIIMLGDGTDESHEKIQQAVNDLWMYTGELCKMDAIDEQLLKVGIAADLNKIAPLWLNKVTEILGQATIEIPTDAWMQQGGKQGKHTEHLSYLLTEMQSVKRQFPEAQW